MRRIEGIKCALGGGEEEAAEIRTAARELERSVSPAEVLAAVADLEFPKALIAAAEGTEPEVQTSWLTLAAVGPRRARQVLAWRGSQLLDPADVVALATAGRRARKRGFARAAASPGVRGAAFSLLAHLSSSELRAMVRARPALAAAQRRARAARGRVPAPALRPVLG